MPAMPPITIPAPLGATFVLTNKASEEVQIAAIKLVDYMFTQEGQLRAHFGEEGKDWRRPQEGDVAQQEASSRSSATIPLPAGRRKAAQLFTGARSPNTSSPRPSATAGCRRPDIYASPATSAACRKPPTSMPARSRLTTSRSGHSGPTRPRRMPLPCSARTSPTTSTRTRLQFVTGAKSLDSRLGRLCGRSGTAGSRRLPGDDAGGLRRQRRQIISRWILDSDAQAPPRHRHAGWRFLSTFEHSSMYTKVFMTIQAVEKIDHGCNGLDGFSRIHPKLFVDPCKSV